MEEKRITQEVVSLIDTDFDQPNPGERVLALTLGGKLIEMTWTKDSRKDFHAYMPFPKTPTTVKNKLSVLYASGKSWGKHGTQVQRND